MRNRSRESSTSRPSTARLGNCSNRYLRYVNGWRWFSFAFISPETFARGFTALSSNKNLAFGAWRPAAHSLCAVTKSSEFNGNSRPGRSCVPSIQDAVPCRSPHQGSCQSLAVSGMWFLSAQCLIVSISSASLDRIVMTRADLR